MDDYRRCLSSTPSCPSLGFTHENVLHADRGVQVKERNGAHHKHLFWMPEGPIIQFARPISFAWPVALFAWPTCLAHHLLGPPRAWPTTPWVGENVEKRGNRTRKDTPCHMRAHSAVSVPIHKWQLVFIAIVFVAVVPLGNWPQLSPDRKLSPHVVSQAHRGDCLRTRQ